MESPFDVFRLESGGTLVWKGAVASLEEAKARVKELAEGYRADYLIVSLKTGMRVRIGADGSEKTDLTGFSSSP